MAPILGYWNIRGLAQPIRNLLMHVDAEFEDKQYNHDDKEQWTKVKFTLGLDFPNLPYYIDGDTKITQSLAILRTLGRKYQLMGKTDDEQIRVDMIEQQLIDIKTGIMKASFDPDFEKAKTEYLKNTFPPVIKSLSDFLGPRPYFAGNSITYVDFLAHTYIAMFNLIAPKVVGEHKNLVEYLARIDALPNIAKYKASPNYITSPGEVLLKWL